MSRIGKMPIALPAGVKVTVEGNLVTVQGSKGTLSQSIPAVIAVNIEGDKLTVTRPNDQKQTRAYHGLTRSLLANMVAGVTEGYSRSLELVGTGYRAAKAGDKVTLSVGYSHPVELKDGDGYTLEVPAQNTVIVKGIDKQRVGEIAATIRRIRPPEPYHGKGIRYTGETIKLLPGKAGVKK